MGEATHRRCAFPNAQRRSIDLRDLFFDPMSQRPNSCPNLSSSLRLPQTEACVSKGEVKITRSKARSLEVKGVTRLLQFPRVTQGFLSALYESFDQLPRIGNCPPSTSDESSSIDRFLKPRSLTGNLIPKKVNPGF